MQKFRCIARNCGERKEGVDKTYVDEAFAKMTTPGAKIPHHAYGSRVRSRNLVYSF